VASCIFDLSVLKNYSFSLLRDESSNMANGVSKNPSFHTDNINVNLILEKSAPKEVLAKNCFANLKIVILGKTFFGCTFY
jgi:hypothetical protein